MVQQRHLRRHRRTHSTSRILRAICRGFLEAMLASSGARVLVIGQSQVHQDPLLSTLAENEAEI